MIANAGLTLYRVHAHKRLDGVDEILAVDGGLSDNPRPALYGASYEVINASRPPGGAREVVRRETDDDLLACDLALDGPEARSLTAAASRRSRAR